MKKIILASASPRRREILSNIGVKFEVEASDFDERSFIEAALKNNPTLSPAEQTKILAEGKAENVFGKLKNTDEFVVIGVDTSVVVDNEILGKPHDKDDAVRMLLLLSNRTHKVISGFAIIDNNGKHYSDYAETLVHMRNISKKEAIDYVNSEYVLDKAGAYAIQGKASLFIEGIEGCYFNVVGLPVYKLADALKKFDIDLSCGGI